MLHIIFENKDLNNRMFPLPKNLRKQLTTTLNGYKGDKSVEGYKRLSNILSMENGISYLEMKRLKNFFDTYAGDKNSVIYQLNGGENMRAWVDNTLGNAVQAVKDFKQAKKDAGVSNAFIRPHEKDRQNKRKNKPTVAKFQTKNANKNMRNGQFIKYEGKERNGKVIVITEEQERNLKMR